MDVKPERGEKGGTGAGEAERSEATRAGKAERSEATRTALIATARRLFAERGYGGVGTEEIVRETGVTRGALYHHFAGKQDLFQAVYEELERELVESIAASAMSAASDPLQALEVGAQAFLDACCDDPAVQRIAVIDAPAVLGWERWREIGMRYGFGLVQATIEEAIEAGLVERQPAAPLAHLLFGALDEGAMVVARAEDGGETRRQLGASIARFLHALGPAAP